MIPLALRLPAELASVEVARQAVLAHLPRGALAPQARFDLELVLEEIITNIARHAYRGAQQPACFDLVVTGCADGMLRLVFEDEGADFDPGRAIPAPRPERLEDAEPGGLGLLLVRQRVARLEHQRGGGRNRLEIDLPCVSGDE